MAEQQIVEGSTIRATFAFSLSLLERTAKFVFTVTSVGGLRLPAKTVTFRGKEATATSDPLPDVPDELDHYVVQVEGFVLSGENLLQRQLGPDTYRVWARSTAVELVPVDGAGTAIAMQAVPFTLTTLAGVTTNDTTAARDGKRAVDINRTQVTIAPVLPWVVHRWVTGAPNRGSARKAEVKKFEPGFISPAPGTHEWVVNRATANAGADKRGQRVSIRVGGKGDAARLEAGWTGVQGAEVLINCFFSKTTARTDVPFALGNVLDGSSRGNWELGRVLLGPDKTATFEVDLGFAGGETCVVEIGTSRNLIDDSIEVVHERLELETWREIDYRMLVPKSDGATRITDLSVLKSTTDPNFADLTTAAIKTAFDPVKVRLVPKSVAFYDATALQGNGDGAVYADGTLFNQPGRRLVVFPRTDTTAFFSALPGYPDPSTLTVLVCDHIAAPAEWTQVFPKITAPGPQGVLPGRYALPKAVDGTIGAIARGAFPVSRIRWKATHFYGPNETQISDPSHPGWDARDWTVLSTEVDIRRHLSLDCRSVTFAFPAGDAAYPGQQFPIDAGELKTGGVKIAITIQVQGACVALPGGSARRGDVLLSTECGTAHVNGLARVIVHELGHCMGQAYGSTAAMVGVPARAAEIPGIPFPAVVPGGVIYSQHGQSGVHCATGVDPRDVDPFTGVQDAQATCVMYGSGDMTAATVWSFCAACQKYVLAENLSDIRKNWSL
jgi:hypothetical protein